MLKEKKKIVLANVLENVKEISTTKLALNSVTSAKIKQMFTSIEAFMPHSQLEPEDTSLYHLLPGLLPACPEKLSFT